jgi:hypothetical protein
MALTPTTTESAPAVPTIDVQAYGKDLVRYVTPLLVGYATTLAAKAGFNLKPQVAFGYIAPFVSAVYFAIITFVEKKVPALGRLLGAKKPTVK